jgi:hypothetical protein
MCFHLLVWQQLVKSIRLVVKIWNNTCHQLCLYFSNCHLSVYNRKQSYKIEGSQEFKKKMLNTIVKAFQSFDHGRTWWSLFQKGVMLNKLDIVKITTIYCRYLCVRKAWRYQRGNQNKYIKEVGHCVVYCSLIYLFWLPLWYLLGIVFSVPLWYTYSDYLFGIVWALCCLFFFDILILISSLVSSSFSYTQFPKDTKEVIRINISKNNRQHNAQKLSKR